MKAKREASFASSLLAVAFVLTLWALLMGNLPLEVEDASGFVLQAVVCSAAAVGLIGGAFYWLQPVPRILSLLIAVVDLWIFVDALGSRILGLF